MIFIRFFTALIGSSSIPTEKCEVCACAIYHGHQIIDPTLKQTNNASLCILEALKNDLN